MNANAKTIVATDTEQEQLAATVQHIHCDEQTAEQWTRQLAGEVTAALSEFYGEVTQEMIEHAVCEVFFQLSYHLRQGHPVTLEAVGTLLPAIYRYRRVVEFRPCQGLFAPMPGKPTTLIKLADRRAEGGPNV